MKLILFFALPFWAFCADYDCIVIGTSPISLFEALYQKAEGKSVLILESEECLGGAWRSLDICGLTQVDLGCHFIGKNQELADFLHEYANCKIVSLDAPNDLTAMMGENGFYFANGCRELIKQLAKLIQMNSIEVLFNHHVWEAVVDDQRNEVILYSANKNFTARKVILTPHVRLCEQRLEEEKQKFYHLYLLIQDPTPPKFSYCFGLPNTVRMSNVTHFADLTNTGKQLIIIQTQDPEMMAQGELLIEQLKENKLIAQSAFLLCSQSYVHSQWPANENCLSKKFPAYFQILFTNHLIDMRLHIGKWKKALRPFPSFESQ